MEFPITKKNIFWSDVTDDEWNDWHWQQSNRIIRIEQLKKIMEEDLTEEEVDAFNHLSKDFMMGITPYYLSLFDFGDKKNALRLQCIPQIEETIIPIDILDDPLGEEHDMPVPGITHRYPDRVLLYTTHNCPVYCRHCTRKRKVSNPLSSSSSTQIEAGLDYIRNHKEIRDVVISGGDPLSLSDEKLFKLISDIQDIPHIEMMRLGTRNFVTLPQRITKEFSDKLSKANARLFYGRRKPVFINTHYNHPDECTVEAAEACYRAASAGSPLGNQSVLLKGVNDNPSVMKELCIKMLSMGIRPYYIYLCDPVSGTSHFRTTVESGLELIDAMRGHTSGFASPQLVIDAPSGGGKILIPNGIVGRHVKGDYTVWKLVNFEEGFYYYIAPTDKTNYYQRFKKPVPPDFDMRDLKGSNMGHVYDKLVANN
ncbi:MAG: KamA family radical SAM protein [archaeon]